MNKKHIGGFKEDKMSRKYSPPHSFRCDMETSTILKILLENTGYSKSELIRICLKEYYDSTYITG